MASDKNIARLNYYLHKIYGGSEEENIINALTDIMHMSARHEVDFDDSLWMARMFFEEESNLTDSLEKELKVSDEAGKLFCAEVRSLATRTSAKDLENPPDGLYILIAANIESARKQFHKNCSFGSPEDFLIVISETTPMEIVEKLNNYDNTLQSF